MAGMDDANSTLQNVVRQIGLYAQSIVNAYPAATSTASPRAIGINTLTTTAAVVVSNSTSRHGIIFHNPGAATSYIFPTAIMTSPTTTLLGGAFVLPPSQTISFSPSAFPNVNCSWSAFSATGSSQPLTIVEFF